MLTVDGVNLSVFSLFSTGERISSFWRTTGLSGFSDSVGAYQSIDFDKVSALASQVDR